MNIQYPYSSNNNQTNDYYKKMIETYFELSKNYSQIPILDTAYYYGNTTTEKILGDILKDLDQSQYKIATKANPWFENDFSNGILGQLSPENIERQLNTSLKNLLRENVDYFFLHAPDHETPIIETLTKCDELYRKEKFHQLGISNYSKEQLEEIKILCENHNLIQPTIYQGMYNLISRKVEEIFPHLEEMEFWAYNPLAGGLLTGKYKNGIQENSRFKNNSIYQNIFWKPEINDKLKKFYNLENNLEYSLIWLKKYSLLRKNDKVIIGASTIEQLEKNIQIYNSDISIPPEIYNDLNDLYEENISPNYYY